MLYRFCFWSLAGYKKRVLIFVMAKINNFLGKANILQDDECFLPLLHGAKVGRWSANFWHYEQEKN